MKAFGILISCLAAFSLSLCKPVVSENTTREDCVSLTKALAISKLKQETDVSQDSQTLLTEALESYKTDFKNYLDITALNVTDRESVALPGYNPEYIAPSTEDIMFKYQEQFESSLTNDQMGNLEILRQQSYEFDRSVALVQTKFRNLDVPPKYQHAADPENVNGYKALAVVGSVGIFATWGLSKTVVSAISACIGALKTALASSTIPFAGWVIAAGIAVGALIALTVIIVQNWDIISEKITEFKNWVIQQFSAFENQINTFFSDAVAKGNASTVASQQTIGDKTFDFVEIKDYALAKVAEKSRRNYDVFIIAKKLKGSSMHIALGFPVSSEWCIKCHVNLLGFSTYTWYQNTARRLIIKGGTGYTSANPELHLRDETSSDGLNLPQFSFKHFHNYTAFGTRDNQKPQVYSHSFFGLLYWTENCDGVGTVHPTSPKN
jgi:hypothetical protein